MRTASLFLALLVVVIAVLTQYDAIPTGTIDVHLFDTLPIQLGNGASTSGCLGIRVGPGAQAICVGFSRGFSAPGPMILATASRHQIIDLTVDIQTGHPVWESKEGLPPQHRTLRASFDQGDDLNASELEFPAHLGTHVDAPRHFVDGEYGIEELDMSLMQGDVAIIDATGHPMLTPTVLEALRIPRTATRIIFRTDNSNRKILHQTPFAEDYVGFSVEGAEWMVQNTNAQVIGIDYLSVCAFPWKHLHGCHVIFLKAHKILIEGLNLEQVDPSLDYTFHCMPLKIKGSDGAPARAILIQK